jgi:hypothetical protein
MLLGLVPVKLKCNMRLPLPASQHLLIQLGATRTKHLRSLLKGSARLRLTLMVVLPIESRADRTEHAAIVPAPATPMG